MVEHPGRGSSHGTHNVVAFPQAPGRAPQPTGQPAAPARSTAEQAQTPTHSDGTVWSRPPASQGEATRPTPQQVPGRPTAAGPDTAPNPATLRASTAAPAPSAVPRREFDRLLGAGTQPIPVANGKGGTRHHSATTAPQDARNGTDNERPPKRT
jgi:hypothetical protein